MDGLELHVVASDALLRRALLAKLRTAHLEGITLPDHDGRLTTLAPGDMVITPVADCPLERCSELARSGVRVIILAPIPRESERQQYLDAGASGYVPMTIDSNDLIAAIRILVTN